jgi:hypothetical protein
MMTVGSSSVSFCLSSKWGAAADDRDVGIGVEAGSADLDAHVAPIHLTGSALDLAAQADDQVGCNKVVCLAGPGHGIGLTVQVFAPGLGLALQAQVGFGGEIGLALGLHVIWPSGSAIRRYGDTVTR